MLYDQASQSFTSCFERTFDAVVVGGGYAGVAAVERLRAAGWSVLLVDRRMALLWESGWAFHDQTGTCDLPGFQRHQGAAAEVEAAVRARIQGWDVLGYATPIAVSVEQQRVVDVAFGTKSGIRRIRARRWLDATDDGEFIRLVGALPTAPQQRQIAVHRTKVGRQFERVALTLGADERVMPGWLRALGGTSERDGWVVSHGSVVAYPTWTTTAARPQLPENVAIAVPAFAAAALTTLAERYQLGWQAAGELLATPAAEPRQGALPVITPIQRPSFAVAVAGTGTGGALAALAAARAGAAVVAIDPLPFAGGIGTGGGIHWYYQGVKGGLQDELDARVRQYLPLFGAPKQVQGFHPDAKKCALDALLHDAGVTPLTGTLISVEREGRAIRSALIATPAGPVTVQAAAWIDGTGDGDLCAQAGCASRFGRAGDGLPHAFSQSSGRTYEDNGLAVMRVVNFDQGFVDATDVEDLTRARLLGVAQYHQDIYLPESHPTYIAPAIGLRQARHIETRTTLELADLIERRRFADSIGRTGCHYDNHASDYEFESDEGMFWVWACRAWHHRTACDIPFGILVPRDLDNTLIASRCLGVSQDAHHSLRMQRDMQRIGEVAGLAATQIARTGAVDLPALQAALTLSGALSERIATEEQPGGWNEGFGPMAQPGWFETQESDIRATDWSKAGTAMWHLYRANDRARLQALLNEADATLSWRGAAVLAMLGDRSALPRLWQAIEQREFGFDTQEAHLQPERFNRVVPVWRQAITLLRCVGTAADLGQLAAAVQHETLHFSLANQIATTVARLAQSGTVTAEVRPAVIALLERCGRANGGALRDPQQNPSQIAGPRPAAAAHDRLAVRDDASWQLAVAVARACKAIGHERALPVIRDERAVVRRAWAAVAATQSAPLAASASR